MYFIVYRPTYLCVINCRYPCSRSFPVIQGNVGPVQSELSILYRAAAATATATATAAAAAAAATTTVMVCMRSFCLAYTTFITRTYNQIFLQPDHCIIADLQTISLKQPVGKFIFLDA
jgi:hypothetical protein